MEEDLGDSRGLVETSYLTTDVWDSQVVFLFTDGPVPRPVTSLSTVRLTGYLVNLSVV